MSPAHAQTRGTLPRWAGTVVLVLAFGLRVPLLNGPRFHPDEALFASFARSIAVWRDPLLATAPVDKPPLLFYLQALCYPFLGPREMAARLPNLWASLVTVAITYAIARQLGRVAPTANDVRARAQCLGPTVAALIVALSPLAIAFGATAFTDPLMVMWGTAAVLAAVGGVPVGPAFGWAWASPPSIRRFSSFRWRRASCGCAVTVMAPGVGSGCWAVLQVPWSRWLSGTWPATAVFRCCPLNWAATVASRWLPWGNGGLASGRGLDCGRLCWVRPC